MQNLMMIKAKCQKENEIFEEQIKALDQKTQDLQWKVEEIYEYKNNDFFIEKVSFLENEYQSLSKLISALDNQKDFSNEIWIKQVPSFSEKKAAVELKKISIMNEKMEKEIKNCRNDLEKIEQYQELHKLKLEKLGKLKKLRETYKKITLEIEELHSFEEDQEDELKKKIKLIDSIICNKSVTPGLEINRKNIYQKKDSLFEDIEASLHKARALRSPEKNK